MTDGKKNLSLIWRYFFSRFDKY